MESPDATRHFKLDHSLTPFRVQTNGEERRRRRSSMASLAILRDELEGPNEQWPRRGRTVRDRFIAGSSGTPAPMNVTPRSRRLAKVVGLSKYDRRLNFHSEENLNPATKMSSVVPFKKDLNYLTRSLYEIPVHPSSTSAATNLCRLAETCLGAPELVDDFYSRLAAWSKEDLLAVAMDNSIVCRNMTTQIITRVTAIDKPESVTCLGWNPRPGASSQLSVGNDMGTIAIYDVETRQRHRNVESLPNAEAVGAFSWRDANVVTVGYFSGLMRQYDIRENKKGKVYRAHRSRICGVEWNPDSRILATGAGDSVVALWDIRSNKSEPLVTLPDAPTHRELTPMSMSVSSDNISNHSPSRSSSSTNPELSDIHCSMRAKRHTSTVKALAWCPWQPDTLATGGGTKDGTIRFWDARRSRLKKPTIATNSQVSSLHFSPSCRELVSTHGYAFAPTTVDPADPNSDMLGRGPALPAPRKHSILVHNFPKGELVGKIFDAPHGRITHSQLSPDGTTIMTCGSDRTIRVYRIWGKQTPLPKEDTAFSLNAIR